MAPRRVSWQAASNYDFLANPYHETEPKTSGEEIKLLLKREELFYRLWMVLINESQSYEVSKTVGT
jgi:hypothetical protein